MDRVQRFAGWLAVSDGDDESRLGVASALHFGDDDSVNNFLSHGCAHRCESLEADSPHQLVDLLLGADVVQHVGVIVAVHEAQLDAVFVEDCGDGCDTRENHLEVIDALAIFFELHRTAVIDVDDHIIEGQFAEIVADFWRDTPTVT